MTISNAIKEIRQLLIALIAEIVENNNNHIYAYYHGGNPTEDEDDKKTVQHYEYRIQCEYHEEGIIILSDIYVKNKQFFCEYFQVNGDNSGTLPLDKLSTDDLYRVLRWLQVNGFTDNMKTIRKSIDMLSVEYSREVPGYTRIGRWFAYLKAENLYQITSLMNNGDEADYRNRCWDWWTKKSADEKREIWKRYHEI